MSMDSIYRRITRRETTSPRATLAIILAVIIILAIAYAVTETILSLVGQPALAATPDEMGAAIAGLSSYEPGAVIAVGVIAAIVGLVLIVVAFKPGRRPRHIVQAERIVSVVDDEVIASAVARHAAYEGNVDPDNARVSVSRRQAVVRLTPSSGTSVEVPSVNRVASDQLAGYGLRPAVKSRVVIEKAKVGA